jgi:hypothetical protein
MVLFIGFTRYLGEVQEGVRHLELLAQESVHEDP